MATTTYPTACLQACIDMNHEAHDRASDIADEAARDVRKPGALRIEVALRLRRWIEQDIARYIATLPDEPAFPRLVMIDLYRAASGQVDYAEIARAVILRAQERARRQGR